MFCKEMLELFQKTPVALPKPVGYINKRQMLSTDIGGKWFMDKNKSKPPPTKMPIMSKEYKKKEGDIKKSLRI